MLLASVETALASAGQRKSGEGRVLVACSGGADSSVLAEVVVRMLGARRVILGHVDHGVRPGSEEDVPFVRALAEQLGCEFVSDRLPPGPDDEARLRTERYACLEKQRIRVRADVIVTGHTADDQAETVLFGLLRSTHAGSLRGIRARNGSVLRPMLDVPRAEVRRYALARSIKFREDPTNSEPRYLRNRIRKELLPLIERRYRLGFGLRLAALAKEFAGDLNTAPRQAVLSEGSTPAPEPGPEGQDIVFWRSPWTGGEVPRDPSTVMFDAAELPRLVVRAVRPGDRMQPFGLPGTKKLQDVFVDAKLPRAERTWVRVVADPDGEVLWVPGLVRSARAPVTPRTREVWILTCGGRSSGSL